MSDSVVVVVILAVVLLITVVIIGGVVGLFFLLIRKSSKFYKQIAAMPTTPISQIRGGELVKIRGTVRFAEETLVDPLSKAPCSAYNISIAMDRGYSHTGDHYVTRFINIATEQKNVDFLIDDGTGVARVSGRLNLLAFDFDAPADSPSIPEFLASQGVAIPDAPISGFGRAIRQGTVLIAVGQARRSAETAPQQGNPVQVIIEPTSQRPINIADHDGTFVGQKSP